MARGRQTAAGLDVRTDVSPEPRRRLVWKVRQFLVIEVVTAAAEPHASLIGGYRRFIRAERVEVALEHRGRPRGGRETPSLVSAYLGIRVLGKQDAIRRPIRE